MTPALALSVAGSDSSGGAGIQADLKTFAALGVLGATVLTAVTAQDGRTVSGVWPLPAEAVRAQLAAVLGSLPVRAVKSGMLHNAATVQALAEALRAKPNLPLVLDPVLAASSGGQLAEDGLLAALREQLLPLAALLTPNLAEASALLGSGPISDQAGMEGACEGLLKLGAKAVLLKGGHLPGELCLDLFHDGQRSIALSAPRVKTPNSRGTGCTLAAAVCARLAQGSSLENAVRDAKDFVHTALQGAASWDLGAGPGPLDHF